MENIYIVNKKASFVHGGRVYQPKDEISASIFSKADLEVLIKNEKLLTKAQAKSAFADDDEGQSPPPPKPAAPPSGKVQKTLDEMNLEELKAFAAEKNITVSGNKADILAAIKAAVNPPPQPPPGKSLDEMNLDELRVYAKEKNVSTKSGPLPWQNMNRDDLLAAIKAAEAENKAGQ